MPTISLLPCRLIVFTELRNSDDLMQTWTLTLFPAEAVWQHQEGTTFSFKTALWG